MRRLSIEPFTMLALIVIGLVPPSGAAVPAERLRDSRYTTVDVGATEAQANLLQSIVELDIPTSVQTVGQGITYLLKPYGYRLASNLQENPEQAVLLKLPLPEPHRTLGPINLREALSVLGGESFQVSVNPVTRVVSYHLRDGYRSQITDADISRAREHWQAQKGSAAKEDAEPDSAEQTPHRRYGPVKPGETLSQIALQLALTDITFDQALVLLFEANPDAFPSGNMNDLLEGIILTVPPVDPSQLIPDTVARRTVLVLFQFDIVG